MESNSNWKLNWIQDTSDESTPPEPPPQPKSLLEKVVTRLRAVIPTHVEASQESTHATSPKNPWWR